MSFADIEVKSSGMFLKIKSGEPVVIRLLQDNPSHKVQHGIGNTAIECPGENCPKCQEKGPDGKPSKDAKAKQRFKLNVYSHDNNKVMLWEFGAGLMKMIQMTEETLKTQEVSILDVDLIISAKGELMDKKYSVQPMLKSRPVPEGLVLHKLEASDLPF